MHLCAIHTVWFGLVCCCRYIIHSWQTLLFLTRSICYISFAHCRLQQGLCKQSAASQTLIKIDWTIRQTLHLCNTGLDIYCTTCVLLQLVLWYKSKYLLTLQGLIFLFTLLGVRLSVLYYCCTTQCTTAVQHNVLLLCNTMYYSCATRRTTAVQHNVLLLCNTMYYCYATRCTTAV